MSGRNEISFSLDCIDAAGANPTPDQAKRVVYARKALAKCHMAPKQVFSAWSIAATPTAGVYRSLLPHAQPWLPASKMPFSCAPLSLFTLSAPLLPKPLLPQVHWSTV